MCTLIYTLDNFFIDQRESAVCTEPIIQIEIILTWKMPIIGRNTERKIIVSSLHQWNFLSSLSFLFSFFTQLPWEQGNGMGNRERRSGEIKCTFRSLGSMRLEWKEFRGSSSLFILQMNIVHRNFFFFFFFFTPNCSPPKSVFRNVMDISNVLSWWMMEMY